MGCHWRAVVRVATPGRRLTQSGSATGRALSSVGSLVDGIKEDTTEHHRREATEVQGLFC